MNIGGVLASRKHRLWQRPDANSLQRAIGYELEISAMSLGDRPSDLFVESCGLIT